MTTADATGRDEVVAALRRGRPRDRFVRASLFALVALMALGWILGDFDVEGLFTARRARNLDRFLERIVPAPVRGERWDWGEALAWAGGILDEHGTEAVLATLAISVLAIVLAGVASAVASPVAARTFSTPSPWLPAVRRPAWGLRVAWATAYGGARAVLIVLRAVPEYVWAFVLLSILGPQAWVAVLALAIHNTGILGRLTAETIENVESRPPSALRGLGARRFQVLVFGAVPLTLPRFLLYFFYRWETCVREATILGTLGVVSLGYYVKEASGARRFDEMLFLILLGSAIVVGGDIVSAVARTAVRRAS